MSLNFDGVADKIMSLTMTSAGLAPLLFSAAVMAAVVGILYARLGRAAYAKGNQKAAPIHHKTSSDAFLIAGFFMLMAGVAFLLGLFGVF